MSEFESVAANVSSGAQTELVTAKVGDQLFGIPVLQVHDVFTPQNITPVALAPKEVAGVLNLRGRIVTAIDLRVRLGLERAPRDEERMALTVEHNGESYSLLIDSVGEVLSLPSDEFERNPANLDTVWREVSEGVFRLDGQLLMVMSVDRLLSFDRGIIPMEAA